MDEIVKSSAAVPIGERVRNTPTEVLDILTPMFALYPQVVVKEETQALYIDLLRDIPPDKLAASVRLCMLECKWLPTVAEIRAHYEEMRQPMPPPVTEKELYDFPMNGKLYRETDQERRERLKRIERTERLYGH